MLCQCVNLSHSKLALRQGLEKTKPRNTKQQTLSGLSFTLRFTSGTSVTPSSTGNNVDDYYEWK